MALTIENNAKKQLLWIGMGSILMFFAGLLSYYIARKAEGNWLDFVFPEQFDSSTLVIVISSFVLLLTKFKFQKNRSVFFPILSVLFLGFLFTFFQYQGWVQLINQGIYLTGEGSNASGSITFVLTAAHLVHLLGGLIALSYVTKLASKEKFHIKNSLAFNLTSLYWHFLALIWLILYILLKFY